MYKKEYLFILKISYKNIHDAFIQQNMMQVEMERAMLEISHQQKIIKQDRNFISSKKISIT